MVANSTTLTALTATIRALADDPIHRALPTLTGLRNLNLRSKSERDAQSPNMELHTTISNLTCLTSCRFTTAEDLVPSFLFQLEGLRLLDLELLVPKQATIIPSLPAQVSCLQYLRRLRLVKVGLCPEVLTLQLLVFLNVDTLNGDPWHQYAILRLAKRGVAISTENVSDLFFTYGKG